MYKWYDDKMNGTYYLVEENTTDEEIEDYILDDNPMPYHTIIELENGFGYYRPDEDYPEIFFDTLKQAKNFAEEQYLTEK